ncbi:MAG: hypothetical protein WC869_13275 [Phycisphaerae bacterium]|jgi:hypothetical protein
MRILILFLSLFLFLVGGCAASLHPVSPAVLSALPPQQSLELQTWSANHPTIWDLRFHRPATCPFGYTLGYPFRVDQPTWPQWLHDFYHQKHLEQDHCPCNAILAEKE